MKSLSLYEEIFQEVEGGVEELGKEVDENKLKSLSLIKWIMNSVLLFIYSAEFELYLN